MELRHIAAREGRLSSFLLGELHMSTGLMNRLKWGDGLRVNDTPQRTNYPVAPGDVITVTLPEEVPEYPVQDGPLTVLFEDDWFLAVDKPAGMLIHPSAHCFDGTLANFVAGYYRKTGQKSAFHPITRLDRDTFGIVLLAKNTYVHALAQEMQARKTYHALVFHGPDGEQGVIDAPIARKPLPSLLREIHPAGKPSVTEYKVLQRRPGCSLLALRPVTGRTHQLRLHCCHGGFPILGDPHYGTADSMAASEALGLSYQQLCAKRIEFVHPITGQATVLESRMDVPENMAIL